MKRPLLIRLGIAFVVTAVVVVIISRQRPRPPATPEPITGSTHATSDHPPQATSSAIATAPGESVATSEPHATPAQPLVSTSRLPVGEAAHQMIETLTVTYDAASVPSLARFLAHTDPEIRAAAREGLVQLGERAAIPFLEEAAKTAPGDEAVALREAAEFLALPTWTERRAAEKKRASSGS